MFGGERPPNKNASVVSETYQVTVDLPQRLVPHVKLGFSQFLFLNYKMREKGMGENPSLFYWLSLKLI